jgi:PPOX class probable F420-dependent enzyme
MCVDSPRPDIVVERMDTSRLLDASSPFGQRAQQRLRDERVIWLTTIGADGTPQPNPVWFLWDSSASSFLVYSLPDAQRLRHIERNPRVALHFDGNGQGGNIVVFGAEARRSTSDPSADQVTAYVDKYRDFIARNFGTPEAFAQRYSVALRITPDRVRGH